MEIDLIGHSVLLMNITRWHSIINKADLGTVQNFLLGGVVPFGKSARKKRIALPPPGSSLRKILVAPLLSLCQGAGSYSGQQGQIVRNRWS